MALRHFVGLSLAVAGLSVITVASANTPMADAFDWFLLLNGAGLVALLGWLSLVTYERLGQVHGDLTG